MGIKSIYKAGLIFILSHFLGALAFADKPAIIQFTEEIGYPPEVRGEIEAGESVWIVYNHYRFYEIVDRTIRFSLDKMEKLVDLWAKFALISLRYINKHLNEEGPACTIMT